MNETFILLSRVTFVNENSNDCHEVYIHPFMFIVVVLFIKLSFNVVTFIRSYSNQFLVLLIRSSELAPFF